MSHKKVCMYVFYAFTFILNFYLEAWCWFRRTKTCSLHKNTQVFHWVFEYLY